MWPVQKRRSNERKGPTSSDTRSESRCVGKYQRVESREPFRSCHLETIRPLNDNGSAGLMLLFLNQANSRRLSKSRKLPIAWGKRSNLALLTMRE
eukprot:6032132-Pleurochrysis_carterae.AAC.2